MYNNSNKGVKIVEPTAMNLFHTLDESTKILKKELEISYLEALIHKAENLIDYGNVYNEENLLSEKMMKDYIQPNYQMTPDSLGSLIAYLIEIIAEPEKNIHLVDLTVGTGNLLLTISHFLNQVPNREISRSGVDNDELMLSLASTNSAI